MCPDAVGTGLRAQKWLDDLEVVLSAEAELSGLLKQSSLVGSSREFFIKRVLRSILPPVVHIGTGTIIDAMGNSSRQMDIVLFDSRFPVFEIDAGIGSYPLEGVIATIEVKSTLTREHLKLALDNTLSLFKLGPHLKRLHGWDSRLQQLSLEGFSQKEAKRKAYFELIPATYIYAFNSRLKKRGLAASVAKWFEFHQCPTVPEGSCAILPRIIVAGHSLALLHDGYVQIQPGDVILEEWRNENHSEPNHIMSFWDTKRRFGWLALHLLHTVCSRIGLLHAGFGPVYDIERYFSAEYYFTEDMEGQQAFHNLW